MGELWFLWPYAAAALAIPLTILYGLHRERRARIEEWRSVAEQAGLRDVHSGISYAGKERLSGHAGRYRVGFQRGRQGEYSYFTRVTVAGHSGITLRPETVTSALNRSFGEREIELGDDGFDDEVEVHGPPERVRAALDVETRRIVRSMLHGHLAVPGRHPVTIAGEVVLVNGELRADVRERPRPTTSQLADVVGALVAIASRFERPVDLPARLAGALEDEPHWRVRLQGLDILATSYPNDRATLAALRHALADENAEVRLRAATALGEEGEAALLEIASSEQRDDATAARAVGALGDRMPAAVAMAVLRRTLRLRHLQTAAALIDTLGQLGGAEVVTLMVKVLLVESGPMAVAAARALGQAATPEVEEALLSALVRDVPGLRLAVIEALGQVGTVRAVLPIEDAAARHDSDSGVRSAARQAIAEIQSRLPGASPGQLSIADGEAGHLSLADDDPRGRVSLPEGR